MRNQDLHHDPRRTLQLLAVYAFFWEQQAVLAVFLTVLSIAAWIDVVFEPK